MGCPRAAEKTSSIQRSAQQPKARKENINWKGWAESFAGLLDGAVGLVFTKVSMYAASSSISPSRSFNCMAKGTSRSCEKCIDVAVVPVDAPLVEMVAESGSGGPEGTTLARVFDIVTVT